MNSPETNNAASTAGTLKRVTKLIQNEDWDMAFEEVLKLSELCRMKELDEEHRNRRMARSTRRNNRNGEEEDKRREIRFAGVALCHACAAATESNEMVVWLIRSLVEHFPSCVSETMRFASVDGQLALHIACGYAEHARYSASAPSSCELCPASRRVNFRVISYLLEVYPKAAAVRNKRGETPLHVACRFLVSHCAISSLQSDIHDIQKVLEGLLQAHSDACLVRDESGRMPLHRLCLHIPSLQEETSAHVVALYEAVVPLLFTNNGGGSRGILAVGSAGAAGKLPIHECCAVSRSISLLDEESSACTSVRDDVFVAVARALVQADPATASKWDAWGRLPLHHAVRGSAPPSLPLVQYLAALYPQGLQARVVSCGFLPLHEICISCGSGNVSQERSKVVPAIVQELVRGYPNAVRQAVRLSPRDGIALYPVQIVMQHLLSPSCEVPEKNASMARGSSLSGSPRLSPMTTSSSTRFLARVGCIRPSKDDEKKEEVDWDSQQKMYLGVLQALVQVHPDSILERRFQSTSAAEMAVTSNVCGAHSKMMRGRHMSVPQRRTASFSLEDLLRLAYPQGLHSSNENGLLPFTVASLNQSSCHKSSCSVLYTILRLYPPAVETLLPAR